MFGGLFQRGKAGQLADATHLRAMFDALSALADDPRNWRAEATRGADRLFVVRFDGGGPEIDTEICAVLSRHLNAVRAAQRSPSGQAFSRVILQATAGDLSFDRHDWA